MTESDVNLFDTDFCESDISPRGQMKTQFSRELYFNNNIGSSNNNPEEMRNKRSNSKLQIL